MPATLISRYGMLVAWSTDSQRQPADAVWCLLARTELLCSSAEWLKDKSYQTCLQTYSSNTLFPGHSLMASLGNCADRSGAFSCRAVPAPTPCFMCYTADNCKPFSITGNKHLHPWWIAGNKQVHPLMDL